MVTPRDSRLHQKIPPPSSLTCNPVYCSVWIGGLTDFSWFLSGDSHPSGSRLHFPPPIFQHVTLFIIFHLPSKQLTIFIWLYFFTFSSHYFLKKLLGYYCYFCYCCITWNKIDDNDCNHCRPLLMNDVSWCSKFIVTWI